MIFWSEFSIKQNAARAERYSQMNEARAQEEGGATFDGLIIEKAYQIASTTEPGVLNERISELLDIAAALAAEVHSIVEVAVGDESEDEGDIEDE